MWTIKQEDIEDFVVESNTNGNVKWRFAQLPLEPISGSTEDYYVKLYINQFSFNDMVSV